MICIVRHGATEWSESGRHTGRTDVALIEEGQTQAKALAPLFAGRPFTRVLTSPRRRARETAALAGFPQAEVTDTLQEIDYGEYEGKTRAEIHQAFPGWELFLHGAPGGESVADASLRARSLLAGLDRHGDYLLFSHGHFSRFVATAYLGADPKWGRHLRLDPTGVAVLGEEGEIPSLLRWNDRHHLGIGLPRVRGS